MIITEQVTIRDREFTRTYSDAGRYVVRDGVEYVEAIDPVGTGREYTEGDLFREGDGLEEKDIATEEDYQQALREMGVEV